MSAVPMPGAQPAPGVTTEVAYSALTPRLAQTADLLAGKASMATSGAEAKDFSNAALMMVQAIITLDPSRLAGGDTPAGRLASMPEPPRPAPGGKAQGASDGNRDGKIGQK